MRGAVHSATKDSGAAWRRAGLFVLGAVCAVSSCGQKGPPLAPLRLVPAAPTELSLRRVEDRARLRFVLPVSNVDGPGPVALDRVEIYAVTVGAGAPAPTDQELLVKENLVGEVRVRPEPVEGEEPAAGDTRPAPGETITFDEELTEAALTAPAAPVTPPAAAATSGDQALAMEPAGRESPAKPPVPGAPGTGAPDAAGAQEPAAKRPVEPPSGEKPSAEKPSGEKPTGDRTAAAAKGADAAAAKSEQPAAARPSGPLRVYIARGVTGGGRAGPPSSRVELPITPVPPPPTGVSPKVTETGVALEWTPPEDLASAAFNVYRAADAAQPLNGPALTDPSFEHSGAELGKEHCYVVRSVSLAGDVAIEGPASRPVCVTPSDVFAPAAPTGLVAVPTPGQISLIWDANTEADVAGYLVLRGDAPEGPLRALTPAPIKEASYSDTSVTPGMRYIYAVVAVDQADPPNTSAQSAHVEETAR